MSAKKKAVKGKIIIEAEMCKACGYCIEHCPKNSIELASYYNTKGYNPATPVGEDCNGCGICAVVCPEGIIEVWRE
ncbi:MAG: 4Fe-4S binding protein [bacterium]